MVDGSADVTAARTARAEAISEAGGVRAALANGSLPARADITLSEALVLGLLLQGVSRYVTVLGHGSTEVGEVLRIYAAAGVVRAFPVRHETAAAHAATALRWARDEKVAVVTSIGPGALQAMSGSLVAASDGIGVWHLYGDETTEDEGPNMQQIPRDEQGLFLRLTATMGAAYSLHTPGALPTALRRGLATVDHPYRAAPFFLLLPLNTQPELIAQCNLAELPTGAPPPMGAAAGDYREAARELLAAHRVVIKVGGGARGCGAELAELAELVDGVFVMSPISVGIVPGSNLRNMTVGGSKGSISGNFAMDQADALLAVGTRAVCQSDSSRTGYPRVQHVVNINADLGTALHYNRTTALVGDSQATLRALIAEVRLAVASGGSGAADGADAAGAADGAGDAGRGGAAGGGAGAASNVPQSPSPWLAACQAKRAEWEAFKAERFAHPTLFDDVWGREVLTQPAAIEIALTATHNAGAVAFFDAGDVQANGFQIAVDENEGQTITDGGASYMGFATSAVLATALGTQPWQAAAMTGDGSFTMNPAVLIDALEHGANGVIVLFDNRRMGAISSLQADQYGQIYATNDSVEVDYVAWAQAVSGVRGIHGGFTPESLRAAMAEALAHDGLALVHVPVYFGADPLGGLGAYGRWNVGNWVADTQAMRHDIGM